MIALHGSTLLAAFNAGREDSTTVAALHRVQAAVLLANGHPVPDGALPAEVRRRIAEEAERKGVAAPRTDYDGTNRLSARDVRRINTQAERALTGRAPRER